MAKRTTVQQRRSFYERHVRGETYQQIADSEQLSKECVRYWCRRLRDGGCCQTTYPHEPRGVLSQFDPLVRYGVLRLRLAHPRWGPEPILTQLRKRPALQGMRLPGASSIGRYLHQWSRFRRRRRTPSTAERSKAPTRVHQRWQMDFKLGIKLKNRQLVNLYTVRDSVGEAVIGAFVFPAGQVGRRPKAVTLEQTRIALRTCFARWGTLPEEVQTDHEPVLVGKQNDPFPSSFTLWLKGLGIDHLLIRPSKPTDNAAVERCHRTVNDYAIVGNEGVDITQLQQILDQAVHELNDELPSRAAGCGGRTPIQAHPQLLQQPRPFQPEWEMALFDLQRVDQYLATLAWERKVDKQGRITLGGQHERYIVGKAFTRQQVWVRFDPGDRHFVFCRVDAPDEELGRQPARNWEPEDLTGWVTWSAELGPQQLPLPLEFTEGVSC